MSNLLIGSSNVYRNFERAIATGCFSGRNLQLVRCTKKAFFDTCISSLTVADLVVTSVLENFIVDGCTGVPDDEVQLFAHQQVTAHVETLMSLTVRLPGVNVIICPPMFRSNPAWYGPYLSAIHAFLAAEVARVGSRQLGVCAPFVAVPSLLEADGIHLTPSGGSRFLSHLDSELQSMLLLVTPSTTEDNTGDSMDCEPGEEAGTVADATDNSQVSLANLVKSTSSFKAFVWRRFQNDDYVFARLKEEADTDLNKSREDRVVVTGLPPPPATMRLHSEKKVHYTETLTRLITLACVAADPLPKVTDVYVNIRKGRGPPLVEARFDSVSGAQLFRREGAKLAKAEQHEFSGLFFSNSVTQTTRVRIEVLKALSKRMTTDAEVAYVQGFISRPVLQYHAKEGCRSVADGIGRSYNYVDAVAKFGKKLTTKDLTAAYVRAGTTFFGSMSQYFIVLSDELVNRGGRTPVNRIPLGTRGGRGGRRGTPIFRPQVEQALERGTKRPGEHVEGPSKKNESDLVIE